jgi:hypothetical protein
MEPYIYFKCFCKRAGTSHCQGDLQISPDTIDYEKVFMFSVADSSSGEDSSMWLDKEQVKLLISSLSGMYEAYFGGVANDVTV